MLFTLSLSFERLFRLYQQELLRFAGQYSNDEVAEDLVQEAYFRLIRQAQTEKIENPRAYLYKITRNLSADFLRHGQIRSRHQTDFETECEQIADSYPGVDAEVDSQDRLQRCLEALDSLPETYRSVFLLHRIDGMTYAEIGKALKIPARTVERYAAKALAHCFAKAQDSQ
jgi:RNA polymerase sigma factor (sigma-70 family)